MVNGSKANNKDGQGCFTYNDQTRLPVDVVIVDEMSMVDEYAFNALVKAINNGARLVLVGDKDQLASVGAGNVLGDLIGCGRFPVSYLTQIYRQSEDSHIIPNAHKINNGEMPTMDNRSRDFFFEEKGSAEEIARTTLELVTKRLPKYLNVRPEEIQVLCPMKRGSAGIYNLNRYLQNALNPASKEKKEFRCGEFVFREGDKVMQRNYDMGELVGARRRRQSSGLSQSLLPWRGYRMDDEPRAGHPRYRRKDHPASLDRRETRLCQRKLPFTLWKDILGLEIRE